MVSIRDVANLAGVSIATVSRVMNKREYVSKNTEKKIIRAIEELNYVPNPLARGLVGKKMSSIAMIVPDIMNPFYPELVRAVEDTCHKQGYTVILCNTDDKKYKEKSYLKVLKGRGIDGFIVASSMLDKENIATLEKENTPCVFLERLPCDKPRSLIQVDNFNGSILAVQHLLDVGCNRIAHIYGPQEVPTYQERMNGYEEVVKSLPWYTSSYMIAGDSQMEGGFKAVEKILDRHPDIDGIFAGNDLMAIGALKALQRRSIRVPEDVAICGFDGIAVTIMTEPELTTVAQPIYEMGELAASTLIGKINGDITDDNKLYKLEVELIPRRSSMKGSN